MGDGAAEIIWREFTEWHAAFWRITLAAKARFEARLPQREASGQRLELHDAYVNRAVAQLPGTNADWARVLTAYQRIIGEGADADLARTFFNSVSFKLFKRLDSSRVFQLDPHTESGVPDAEASDLAEAGAPPIYRTYSLTNPPATARRVLIDLNFAAPFADLEADVAFVADYLRPFGPHAHLDVVASLFYRNVRTYLVGRVRVGDASGSADATHTPLAIPLVHPPEGIRADAVLTTPAEVLRLFDFTRSYFMVSIARPNQVVQFLLSILPVRLPSQLYINLGYQNHGKTRLYSDLMHYLQRSHDRFEVAPGIRGLVMAVFTLPGYHTVFKVIKDRPGPPKNTTAAQVMQKYELVYTHDRVGRLADTQEFRYLVFDQNRFDPGLLRELLALAPSTVSLEGDRVVISHLYTEPKMVPLNLYVQQVPPEEAIRAVLDYGNAIRELAQANLFPGDLLMKNFGVMPEGRVVFYDYDEVSLLPDCRFRRLPQPRHDDDEYGTDWFSVGENDVFPEEWLKFLIPVGPLREAFVAHHADLLGVAFWQHWQRVHQRGEVVDLYPYRSAAR